MISVHADLVRLRITRESISARARRDIQKAGDEIGEELEALFVSALNDPKHRHLLVLILQMQYLGLSEGDAYFAGESIHEYGEAILPYWAPTNRGRVFLHGRGFIWDAS
jgi:hypothetical protein